MSVPEAAKRANHQVISMGYNISLLKALVALNIVLLILLGCSVFWNSSKSGHEQRSMRRLSQRVSDLEVELQSQKLLQGNCTHPRGEFSSEQSQAENSVLLESLQEELKQFRRWRNRVNKDLAGLAEETQILAEDLKHVREKLGEGEQAVKQMADVVEYLYEAVKKIESMVASLELPDIRQNLDDLKSSLPEVNVQDLREKFSTLMGGIGSLFEAEDSSGEQERDKQESRKGPRTRIGKQRHSRPSQNEESGETLEL